MTIAHHPADDVLAAYAAGALSQAQHAAVATHLTACAGCRSWVRTLEEVGGRLLEDLPPSGLAPDALTLIEARLDAPRRMTEPRASADDLADVPGLPAYLHRFSAGPWQRVAPGLDMRRIHVPADDDARLFLLRSKPGLRLLPHAHSGTEMTCVLTGGFSHDGNVYGPGDFDLGEPDSLHEIRVGAEETCISLVALTGEVKFRGLLGWLIQSFMRL